MSEGNVCPLIQVACQSPEVPKVGGIVNLLEEMLEECQREARYAADRTDAMILFAKRDALSEVLMRVRKGRGNPVWARLRPSVVVELGV